VFVTSNIYRLRADQSLSLLDSHFLAVFQSVSLSDAASAYLGLSGLRSCNLCNSQNCMRFQVVTAGPQIWRYEVWVSFHTNSLEVSQVSLLSHAPRADACEV